MRHIQLFISAFGFYFFCDLIWIGIIAKSLYHNSIGVMLRNFSGPYSAYWFAAIGVYVLIVVAIVIFAYPKAHSFVKALGWGALLGFIIYGVYDLTNFAVLAGWPLNITLIDVAWGTFLNALTTGFVYYVDRYFLT